MEKKKYNLQRATEKELEMFFAFAELTNLSRKQMVINDRKKDISGFNRLLREKAIKPKSIKNIIRVEKERLKLFLNERDVAKAFNKLERLIVINPASLSKILVKEGGSIKGLASRIRQNGLTLEEKHQVCDYFAGRFNKAFELVDGAL